MDTVQQVKEFCDDICTITGIKTVILDANMRSVYVHDRVMGALCSCVREDPRKREDCARCDQAGLEQCLQTGQPVIYRCHLGMTEAVVPVLEEDAVIGYLRFGQILLPGDREAVAQRIRCSHLPKEAEALDALAAFPETPRPVLEAAVRLMTACVSSMRLRDILRLRKRNLALEIDNYIADHLAEPELSIGSLCRAFGVSRSTLYNISKEAFGLGITEQIRRRRVRRAVQLLRRGGMSVCRVAEAVGIPDANYLSKLIKAETGLTPKKLQQAP